MILNSGMAAVRPALLAALGLCWACGPCTADDIEARYRDLPDCGRFGIHDDAVEGITCAINAQEAKQPFRLRRTQFIQLQVLIDDLYIRDAAGRTMRWRDETVTAPAGSNRTLYSRRCASLSRVARHVPGTDNEFTFELGCEDPGLVTVECR
jgi:hypothetical protein